MLLLTLCNNLQNPLRDHIWEKRKIPFTISHQPLNMRWWHQWCPSALRWNPNPKSCSRMNPSLTCGSLQANSMTRPFWEVGCDLAPSTNLIGKPWVQSHIFLTKKWGFFLLFYPHISMETWEHIKLGELSWRPTRVYYWLRLCLDLDLGQGTRPIVSKLAQKRPRARPSGFTWTHIQP